MGNPEVIFIGGHGRSGTTILDRVLSELIGGFSAGEVHRFWNYGLAEGWKCSCRSTLRNCKFWGTVLPRVFSKTSNSERDVFEMWRTVARPQSLPFLHYPSIRPSGFRRKLENYRTFLGAFYRTVAEQAETNTIVDSSGSPLHGYVLSGLRNVDIDMIHLVRDVRAVAYSNRRRKPNPSSPFPNATTATKSTLRVAATWTLYNAILDGLGRDFSKSLFAKYEELFSEPRSSLFHLARRLSDPDTARESIFKTEQKVELGPHHSGQGNPVRYQTGQITLEVDSEWKSGMSESRKGLLKTICYPMLRKYRYE